MEVRGNLEGWFLPSTSFGTGFLFSLFAPVHEKLSGLQAFKHSPACASHLTVGALRLGGHTLLCPALHRFWEFDRKFSHLHDKLFIQLAIPSTSSTHILTNMCHSRTHTHAHVPHTIHTCICATHHTCMHSATHTPHTYTEYFKSKG